MQVTAIDSLWSGIQSSQWRLDRAAEQVAAAAAPGDPRGDRAEAPDLVGGLIEARASQAHVEVSAAALGRIARHEKSLIDFLA